MAGVIARAVRAATLSALALGALGARGGTAVVTIMNAGEQAIVVDDSYVGPGCMTRVSVPSGYPGRLDVSVPDGYALTASPAYPALGDGATFAMRLHLVRDAASDEPASTAADAARPQPASAAGQTATPSSAMATAAAAAPKARAAAGGSAGGAAGAVRFDMPLLWVRGEREGGCSRSPFTLERGDKSRPLRISVSEDVSGGVGSQMRASTWQAAVAAAFLRNDPLSGVRIEREGSGFVDGPSAGGVTCLAILSALDGRPFPDDFAMTGTIMADGTIGLVGGVALKLEGAKAAGIRRVCIPAFARLEKQDDGGYVDLHAHARSLGLSLYPVNNVEEAYAIAHDLPMPAEPSVPDSAVYRDIPKIDEALHDSMMRDIGEALSANERAEAEIKAGDDRSRTAADLIEKNRDENFPEKALVGGMFHVGVQLSAEFNAYGMAHKTVRAWLRDIHDLDEDDPAAYVELADIVDRNFRDTAKYVVSLENEWYDDALGAEGIPPLAAQCIPVNLFSTYCHLHYFTEVPDLGKVDISSVDEDFWETILNRIARREVLCAWHRPYAKALHRTWRDIAAALPPVGPSGNLAAIEDFFYSARMAQHKAIAEDFGKYETILGRNYDWQLYERKANEADTYHERAKKTLEENPTRSGFAMALSVMAQIDTLAHGQMIATLFGNENGFNIDADGKFSFSHGPYLGYLLRTARTQAVRAMAECRMAKIPCPRVKAHIETGDYFRDTSGYDVFDVLREYWCARLKAKALLMMFKRGER